MPQDQWTAVDSFYQDLLLGEDTVLADVLRSTAEAGLPSINVSALQGNMLQLFAKMIGAKQILEIGTLGGFSAICMARALPENGKLISLEVDPDWAAVARSNIERAGLQERIEVRVGKALNSLPGLEQEGFDFDMVFLDADKRTLPNYLQWALRLTHAGSLIIADNVARNGEVLDQFSDDPNVIGTRRYLELAGQHPELQSTAIQTVGNKGYDGFCMSWVRSGKS